MKTIKDYKKDFLSISTTEQFIEFIEDIQKEAYNQAIIDVFNKMGDISELILKLKK